MNSADRRHHFLMSAAGWGASAMLTTWVALFVVLTLFGCSSRPKHIVMKGLAQGSYYSIQYYDWQGRNLQSAIDSLLNAFDQEVSLWVDSSLLRRVNSNSTTRVTPLFADVLQKSLDMCDYTQGAFDCRMGGVVQVWGFSFKQRQAVDDSTLTRLLLAARAPVTLLRHSNGGGEVRKISPATEIDFNAIAQGYASDLVGAFLESCGITDYLIDIGGEVLARGRKADGSLWHVGVERPAVDRFSRPEVALAIALDNRAIVTSGSYRKYYEQDGQRYSHTIDPATGRPVTHTLLSVSVVDSTAWRADALATAFMVMGVDSAWRFIALHDSTLPVLFIYDDQGRQCLKSTATFDQLIIQ